MNYNGYSYGGYPANGYYNPPVPDQLAQLRGAQMQQPAMPINNQPMQMQPQNNFQMQQQTTPQQNSNEMIWVQGEAAAKSYIIAPGNTVILWDSENPVIYIKSSDASGIPSMKILDYTERIGMSKMPLNSIQEQECNYVTRDEWAALTARVDALTSKSEPKAKKNTAKEIDE